MDRLIVFSNVIFTVWTVCIITSYYIMRGIRGRIIIHCLQVGLGWNMRN